MTRSSSARFVFVAVLALASWATVAEAGTVRGTVVNGTTGKPAAGIELALIQLQGGKQEVAHSKSGAEGGFTFDNPAICGQPELGRGVFHRVDFHPAPAPS